MSFVDDYQYSIAWTVYILSGIGCCLFWWKATSFINHRGWRELLRGFVFVLIFTPWFAGENTGEYAPAIVVLLIDLLLEGTQSGLNGGVALLFATFSMLIVLTIRSFLHNRLRDV